MAQISYRSVQLVFLAFASLSSALAQYTPTITGVNAFWWLGTGIVYDGPGCGTGGWCFYTQAAWTANPNGAPGSPSWTVQTKPGGGDVTLNCYYGCTTVTATATAPSDGCQYDITVTVSYGQYTSPPFTVLINTAGSATLAAGYPKDSAYIYMGLAAGYDSITGWNVTDLCGNTLQNFDANESFGVWFNDYYGNNWPHPTPRPHFVYTIVEDEQATFNLTVPPSEPPQTPLTNVKVIEDIPWILSAFSQNSGAGVSFERDDQVYYQDHGRHN